MHREWSHLIVFCLALFCFGHVLTATIAEPTDTVSVVFSAVLPMSSTEEMVVQWNSSENEPLVLHSSADLCVHQRSAAVPSQEVLQSTLLYRYGRRNSTTKPPKVSIEWESFWRRLEECRVAWNGTTTIGLVHEFYNQSQTILGLEALPYLTRGPSYLSSVVTESEGVRPPPPSFIDDNQVVTLSFWMTEEALSEVIWNPEDEGNVYVSANMSYVSLNEHKFIEGLEIRRAGGISLHMTPYSYQVKMSKSNNLGGPETKFKLKAFPKDYAWNGGSSADIIAEKSADDFCTVLGAPINYMSLCRLYINNVYQGIYGLIEKIDDNFIDRRWPYSPLGNSVGTLYKTQQSNFYLLDDDGWVDGRRDYFLQLGSGYDVCCPCYDLGCDVEDDCDVVDSGDECYGKNCCQCSWQKNGSMDVEEANCVSQRPFDDFIPLGDSVVAGERTTIEGNLNVIGYLRSAICEMTVMNADGYLYNGKNYYWYRNVNTGQFELITYDQDTSFTVTEFIYDDSRNILNWTEGLSDALFLPTFFENPLITAEYESILRSYVEQFYRSDRKGVLYQRMDVFSQFIAQFNPERVDLLDKVDSFQSNFIIPLSLKLQQELNITTLSHLTPAVPQTCNATD